MKYLRDLADGMDDGTITLLNFQRSKRWVTVVDAQNRPTSKASNGVTTISLTYYDPRDDARTCADVVSSSDIMHDRPVPEG